MTVRCKKDWFSVVSNATYAQKGLNHVIVTWNTWSLTRSTTYCVRRVMPLSRQKKTMRNTGLRSTSASAFCVEKFILPGLH